VRYAKAYPELSEATVPTITDDNLFAAVDYARVLLDSGDTARASHLLEQIMALTSGKQRGGTFGFWLTDVSALALQGKTRDAIARLRQAIDSGYRIKLWYHLYRDPNFDSIRNDPEFLKLRSRSEELIREQAEKYAALNTSLQLDAGGT